MLSGLCVKQASHYAIGHDMKQWVVAEELAIWLKSELLWSTLLHDTINFLRLHFPVTRRDLSEVFEHAQNVTTACDALRFLESWPKNVQRVTHYTI